MLQVMIFTFSAHFFYVGANMPMNTIQASMVLAMKLSNM